MSEQNQIGHMITAYVDIAPVATWLTYDRTAPYAVTVSFRTAPHHWVVWEFARDLLLAGLTSSEWVGEGDVRLLMLDESWIALGLNNDRHRAVLYLPRAGVAAFLGAILMAVPAGREHPREPSDAELARVLTRSAPK